MNTVTQNKTLGCLGLQARVIATLILRETRTSFGQSTLGYLWAIITPAASVALLFFIYTLIGSKAPYGESLTLFFATGILTIEFFNKLSQTLMTGFITNKEILIFPMVKEIDILFARLILISATYLVIMLFFYVSLIGLGLAPFPAHPEKLLEAFLAIIALGLGFGVFNAVIVSLWRGWAQIASILTRPLFFISGVFYVPDRLPEKVLDLVQWNPVLHLVEWMREGFYPHYDSAVFNPEYPLFLAMILILAGLAGERFFR